MNTPRLLPQSVVDFLDERRNPRKPPKPYKSLTDDELRAIYGKRHDEPSPNYDTLEEKRMDIEF